MPRLRGYLQVAILSMVLVGTVACQAFDHDMQSLGAFAAAYEQFDRRVSEFSRLATEANEHAADKALADLAVRASMQLSSFMKNDGAMMSVAHQISDIATGELAMLKESKRVAVERRGDSAALLNKSEDARKARTAAYAHFARLLEAPPNSD